MAGAQRRGGGRQGGSGSRGASGRGRSATSGGRASGGRSATGRGQRPATRGGSGGGGGGAARGTTRSGRAASGGSGGSPALLIGGLVVAVLVVVGIMAAMGGGGGGSGKKKEKREKSTVGLADLRDQVEGKEDPKPLPYTPSSSSSSSRKPKKLDKNIKPRKPMSYFQAMVDMKIWNKAKDKAREAQQLLAMVKRGERPAGMTEKAAKDKIKELFGGALEIANEFLEPVENQNEDAKHFLRRYDDIMVSWQRQLRSVVYGRNK